MFDVDVNTILERHNERKIMMDALTNFDTTEVNFRKGIYVYGEPGTGKTTFVTNILKEMNYDVILYNAGDVRSKGIIDMITKHNMSDRNVLSMLRHKIKRIAIVMDEIDGMNNGDKGGINALIKLIRPKKTKKQLLEDMSVNPIICIGNYHTDKKIKELTKVCLSIELRQATPIQIRLMLAQTLPTLNDCVQDNIVSFVQSDLRKLGRVLNMCRANDVLLSDDVMEEIFQQKSYDSDTKKIALTLFNTPCSLNEHHVVMNETDRTIVGLLWHENIIDVISKVKKQKALPFYVQALENICFADNVDRLTFQKQIWQFNEMSSITKTFKNNKLYHDTFHKKTKYSPSELRFTKVLTKYSTEYNNSIFIQDICQRLGMDKKDMLACFMHFRSGDKDISALETYDITKLELNRVNRYLDKYVSDVSHVEDENDIDAEVF